MATSSSQISLLNYTFRPEIWKPITDFVFEVYKPIRGCINIEIVFFHGFHTNDHSDAYYRTWIKGDSSVCWLYTWLVERFPQSRILSVAYDVSLMMLAFSGQHDIYPYGKNFVSSLVELAGVGQSCPVMLVGHCVGGLVLKEICLQAEKFAAVKSIYEPSPYETFLKYVKVAFFYKTPNFGTRVRMEGISGQDGPMLQNLALLTTRFAKVNAAFRDLRKRYGWRTFGATSANETPLYLHDKLPESCGDLQQFKELKIQDCSRLETPWESFSQLGRLRRLKLRHLTAFLSSIQEMRLEFCHTIAELPESFVELQRARVEIYSCDGLEGLCSNRGQLVSFRSKWRSDLTALGFGSFQDVFNPKRIACLFTNQSTERAIQMIFLHIEGMALFIGVGLPYAEVSFLEDGIVKVQEIQESAWSDLWMESNIKNYKLMLFDSTTWTSTNAPYTSPVPPAVSCRGRTWTIEDAAERFGVGVEGMNVFKEVGYHPEFCQPTPRSPYWMEVFYKHLSQTGQARSHLLSEGNSKDASVRLHPTQIDSSITDVNLNRNDRTSQESDHGEAICVDQIPDGKQQPLKLDVIIYLDGSNCQFIKESEASTLEISKQQEEITSSRWELIETHSKLPQSHETHSQPSQSRVEMEGIKDASNEFELTPILIVRFLYHPSGESGVAKKIIETNLEVLYYLKANILDENKFGWYHDELLLSFTCGEPEKVHRTKGEIHGTTEILHTIQGHSNENSRIDQAEKNKELKVCAGNRSVANLQYMQNSRTGTTRGKSTKEDRQFGQSVTVLVDSNFAIREVGRASQLAYEATIFPPLGYFNKWDPIDRNMLRSRGIMSAVRLQVEGTWYVREEPVNETPPDDQNTRSECCPYEFSCERKLILDEITPQKPTKDSRSRFSKLIGRKSSDKINENPIKTKIIKQVFPRKFLINHAFSHMPGLKRESEYIWNLVRKPQAPCPIDQLIS